MRPERRNPFVFFVDECLGRDVVPDGLRAAVEPGERVHVLPKETQDGAWLPQAGSEGWVCLSKDRAIQRTPALRDAVLVCKVALFTLGEANGAEHVARIVAALPVIRRVLATKKPAIIARIEPGGVVVLRYADGVRLEPPRHVRPKIHERRP